jgi:hypothetical protein
MRGARSGSCLAPRYRERIAARPYPNRDIDVDRRGASLSARCRSTDGPMSRSLKSAAATRWQASWRERRKDKGGVGDRTAVIGRPADPPGRGRALVEQRSNGSQRLERGDLSLAFFSTITTLATPQDVTLQQAGGSDPRDPGRPHAGRGAGVPACPAARVGAGPRDLRRAAGT